MLEQPLGLLALKAGLSVGLLLGPTILMGGTLPLIAAWLNRRGPDAGRLSARFYVPGEEVAGYRADDQSARPRLVIADAGAPRDGKFIDVVGSFNPMLAKTDAKRIQLDKDKAQR